MGGQALKHLHVKRFSKLDYERETSIVEQQFKSLFHATILKIPAYRQKNDFGDCDFLIDQASLPSNWSQQLSAMVNSKGMIQNGNVTSIEINHFQYDFIALPAESLAWAYTYFAYNDLGNLMGRIAHNMGFKYGQTGLHYVYRHHDHILASIPILISISDTFEFLGYSYARWQQGFETLVEVFEFVASSPWFATSIYLLENRNHASRIRDAKRKTYMAFLAWCQTQPSSLSNVWSRESNTKEKALLYHRARLIEQYPNLANELAAVDAQLAAKKQLRDIFNGELVNEWTGLEGKALGQLMKLCREHPDFSSACHEHRIAALVKHLYHTHATTWLD